MNNLIIIHLLLTSLLGLSQPSNKLIVGNLPNILLIIFVLLYSFCNGQKVNDSTLINMNAYQSHSGSSFIDTNNVRVYKWINSPHASTNDKFLTDEFMNLNGPIRYVLEYVTTDPLDSIKHILRFVQFNEQGNITLLRYYWANDHSSQEILEYKDATDYYWQYNFTYKRNRLKEEKFTWVEGDTTWYKLTTPLSISILKNRPFKVLTKDKKYKHLLTYERNIHGGVHIDKEMVICEYDDVDRKSKEIVKDSNGNMKNTTKYEYFNSKIIVKTYNSYQEKETCYKLDHYGNWYDKVTTYPNKPIYGKNIIRRNIMYYE